MRKFLSQWYRNAGPPILAAIPGGAAFGESGFPLPCKSIPGSITLNAESAID
jgi:hypothetical protein